MPGAGGAGTECVCTFPARVGLNPCQPSDGCTAEPVYLITTIINQIVRGSGVGGPNTASAPGFTRSLCRIVHERKPSAHRAWPARPRHWGTRRVNDKNKDGERKGKKYNTTDVDFFPCRFLKVLKKNNQLHVGMLLFILKGTPQQKGKDVSNPWLSLRVFCLPCC